MSGPLTRSMPDPLVSVVVPTYRHVRYIAECLDSILAQRCDFQWEVIIGEDGSDDGAKEICDRYAELHPGRIKVHHRDRRDVIRILGQDTGRSNVMKLYAEARGRFIAICEGDDLWSDPLKLQRQVDLMLSDPGCVLCFHRAELLRSSGREPHPIPPDVDMDDVRVDDLIEKHNFITTASIMFRKDALDLPRWFRSIPFGDLTLCTLLSRKGRIRGIDRFMSIYRITGTGLYTKVSDRERAHMHLRFFRMIRPVLTTAQRSIADRKTAEILEKLAHARFPVNPRKKVLYRFYLRHTLR